MALGNKTDMLDDFIFEELLCSFCSFKKCGAKYYVPIRWLMIHTLSFLGNVNTLQSLLWKKNKN